MLDKKSIQIMNYLINEEEISLTKLMSKTSQIYLLSNF